MDILKLLGQHVNDLNTYLGSPEQKGKILGWTPNQVQNMAVSGMMSTGDWSGANAAVDALTSRPIDGPPLTSRAFTKMQPITPAQQNIGQLQQATQSPDLSAYENALNTGNKAVMDALAKSHLGDARFTIHQSLQSLLGG